jgi:hypothetical protein
MAQGMGRRRSPVNGLRRDARPGGERMERDAVGAAAAGRAGGSMGRRRAASAALLALAAAACAGPSPRVGAEGRIASEAAFRAAVVDRVLTQAEDTGESRLVIGADGRLTLTFTPEGEAAPSSVGEGRWRWRNGRYCRELAMAGRVFEEDCREVRLRDGAVRFWHESQPVSGPWRIGPPAGPIRASG